MFLVCRDGVRVTYSLHQSHEVFIKPELRETRGEITTVIMVSAEAIFTKYLTAKRNTVVENYALAFVK